MVSSRDFSDHFNSKKEGHVYLADEGKTAKIKGIGSGAIKFVVASDTVAEIKISDVLHVPTCYRLNTGEGKL